MDWQNLNQANIVPFSQVQFQKRGNGISNIKRLKDGFASSYRGAGDKLVKPYSKFSRWRGGLDGTQ